jgi:hypothetical protein
MVKHSIDTADATSKAAQKAGITTEAFSALAYAADLSDVSSDQLEKGLIKLASSAYTAATAGGETADTFRKLGVNVKNTDGSLKDSGTLLSELSAKFAAMPDGAEKSAMAVKVFGEKLGGSMIPLLNSGADGLARMGEEALKTGNIISSDTARQAEELNDNLTRLKKASEGVANQFAADLLPGLSHTAEGMAELAKEGHPVLALFKGLVSLPWDLMFPPENIRDALSVTNRLKDLNAELSQINGHIKESEGKGALFRWMYGSKEELQQSANMIQMQIATIERHRTELEAKQNQTKPGAAAPGLDDEAAKKSMDAMLANAQKFADELTTSNESAFEKRVRKYVEMEDKLTAAGAAGAAARKSINAAFAAVLAEEQEKVLAADQVKVDKETETNNKLVEAQQEKFRRMAELATEASLSGEERENARYEAQMRTLERDRQVLEDKHLWDLESEARYHAALEAIKQEHGSRVTAIDKTESDKRQRNNLSASQAIISMSSQVAGAAAGFLEATGNKNSEMAKIIFITQNGLAVAQAVINTELAYLSAMALGPAGWAIAPTIRTLGYISVGLIAATAIVGGGSGGSAGGSIPTPQPGGDLTSPPPPPSSGSSSNQQQAQPMQVNIYNTGNVLSADYVENTIIPQIRDSVSNSDVLIIDPRSRQAQVLAPA